jgi:ketosteroid isomerase-like protein
MVSGVDSIALEGVLEDFLQHLSSRDFERLLELFSDDVVYEDVARGGVRHGTDDVQAAMEEFILGFPDAIFERTSHGSRFASGSQGGIE